MTSLAPRHGFLCLSRSQPLLIPARICFGLVALHLVLTFGGIIFLYRKFELIDYRVAEGRAALLSTEKQEISHKALARMAVELHNQLSGTGYLQWDTNYSVCLNINCTSTWLTILQPGDYYIYSRVTFFEDETVEPPVRIRVSVDLKDNVYRVSRVVMRAYCSLASSAGSPHMCTTTQGDMITLERGDQLSVWIQDLSLVSYKDSETTFVMYQL